ncbi:DUF3841 domain-containing protein [Pandoraea soli]|uniref:DUF3841 domain-containing protein n=1 Tax=Pandoraea soli TaxID=2508293 RepID=A0ABY6VQL2_9BURK|nr:DUF3841 domain-containing protein [Pandoraea soli]VVD71704.1 hypothetical protein PSO31014_00641 [Pandoraea soli]
MRKIPTPTAENHVQLWTFQHVEQLSTLLREGVLCGDWKNIEPADEKAYRYMCRAMEMYELDCGDAPPIWAWHSCWGARKAPDSAVAAQFLSLAQLAANNTVLLSLECPDDQYLLSNYHEWCDLVYFPSLSKGIDCVSERAWQEDDETDHRIFCVDLVTNEADLVQATLPIVRKEWLRQVHRVGLDGEGVQFRRLTDAIDTVLLMP